MDPVETMLEWFGYAHLPPALQPISKSFHDQAYYIVAQMGPSAERSMGLRKLLESKDCIVRAAMKGRVPPPTPTAP